MKKYIDAEKLIKFKETLADIIVSSQGICTYQDCKDIAEREALLLIATLQQEQPEVDLEEEVKKYFQGYWPGTETAEQCNTDMHFTPPAIMRLVKYAYELGLNARKEENK